jgi:hypothetical protein
MEQMFFVFMLLLRGNWCCSFRFGHFQTLQYHNIIKNQEKKKCLQKKHKLSVWRTSKNAIMTAGRAYAVRQDEWDEWEKIFRTPFPIGPIGPIGPVIIRPVRAQNGRRDDAGRRRMGLGASRPISLAMKTPNASPGFRFCPPKTRKNAKKAGNPLEKNG